MTLTGQSYGSEFQVSNNSVGHEVTGLQSHPLTMEALWLLGTEHSHAGSRRVDHSLSSAL